MKRRRRTRIGGQFCWRLVDMMESPVIRVLNQSEHRLLLRLEIEMARHGGTSNGRLIVTHKQFCDYGIDREAISPSIRCLVALRLIEVTKHGRGGNAEYREANEYRLTFRETDQADPTNEWRQIKTKEEAMRLAVEARRAKNAGAVARSVNAAKKQKAASESPQASGRNLRRETELTSPRNPRPSGPGRNLRPTIYISDKDTEQPPREARPPQGASGAAVPDNQLPVASRPLPPEARLDILQARVASRLGQNGWSILGEINPDDLEGLISLEGCGELSDHVLELVRRTHLLRVLKKEVAMSHSYPVSKKLTGSSQNVKQ